MDKRRSSVGSSISSADLLVAGLFRDLSRIASRSLCTSMRYQSLRSEGLPAICIDARLLSDGSSNLLFQRDVGITGQQAREKLPKGPGSARNDTVESKHDVET
jgi:hypothetical protein